MVEFLVANGVTVAARAALGGANNHSASAAAAGVAAGGRDDRGSGGARRVGTDDDTDADAFGLVPLGDALRGAGAARATFVAGDWKKGDDSPAQAGVERWPVGECRFHHA